jgi:hypothetical protein
MRPVGIRLQTAQVLTKINLYGYPSNKKAHEAAIDSQEERKGKKTCTVMSKPE